jgi:hypothetical protein
MDLAFTPAEVQKSAVDHDRARQQQADGDGKCEAGFQKTRHLASGNVTRRSGSQKRLAAISKIVSG